MLKFNGSTFYDLVTVMVSANTTMKRRPADKQNEPLSPNDKKTAPRVLRKLRDQTKNLGAKVTELALAELLVSMRSRKKPMTVRKISDDLDIIQETLRRELSLIHLFVLESGNEKYFAPKEPLFGSDFEMKFPSAMYEVDEAGKCLALGRPTACVFHLMRVMEIGVRAVARCLKIPDPIKPGDRNWGEILRRTKEAMDFRTKTGAWTSPKHKEFFETAYVSLDAVRAAWRNTTMHVENKYASDEAEHILLSVRVFMKTLSSQMDEEGKPEV
jgi:hypothetical protein